MSSNNKVSQLPLRKPRRSRPRRPYTPRCDWCDESMPAERNAVYCSNKCRQAAFRLRKKTREDHGKVTQMKAQIKQLLSNQHILEEQLERAEFRSDEWLAESVEEWEAASRARRRYDALIAKYGSVHDLEENQKLLEDNARLRWDNKDLQEKLHHAMVEHGILRKKLQR